jgi:hypothetical protein
MKKLLTLVAFCLCFSGIRANLATPQAYISEIYVDSTGAWTIELGFWYEATEEIDSMRLYTSSGNALITSYSLITTSDGIFEFLSLITDENLSNSLTINPESDFVKIVSYAWGDQPSDYVAFGDYPGSFLNCPDIGSSVIMLIYYSNGAGIWEFCMDNSPTIGLSNDTTGAMGSYSGIAYDLAGTPFSEGKIFMPEMGNLVLIINPDGSFSQRVPCRNYDFDTIKIWQPSRATQIYTVEPFSFCLRPDSTYYQDIITTSLIIGVDEEVDTQENIVTIAPNPFSDQVVFYFNLNEISYDYLTFNIYSLAGRNIAQFNILPGQTRLEWAPPASVPSGTCIYQLENQNKTLKTGKFVHL